MPADRSCLHCLLIFTVAVYLTGCSKPVEAPAGDGGAAGPSGPDKLAHARSAGPEHTSRDDPWWDEISRRPDSWYRSPAGLTMAENILSWQDASGGWPRMNTTRRPFQDGDLPGTGSGQGRVSLVDSTVDEMRFLARGYRATSDARYRAAVLRGLRFLLDAQQNTGGWPRAYPSGDDSYDHYATLSDGVIPDIMTLLCEVAQSGDFDFLGQRSRQRARSAFDRGLRFIQRTQIMVNGRLTAWARQYDPLTLEPRAAQPSEPVALSSAASAGVVELLMSVDKPDERVKRSIRSAVDWFREVGVEGYRVVDDANDRKLVRDPDAPTLWARFYGIGSNEPLFTEHDGAVRDAMADLERARRVDCAWFNRRGAQVVDRFAQWQHERRWDGLLPTNTDETLVGHVTLPEPLVTEGGTRVDSVEDWEVERRPELLRLFAEHQFGVTPSRTIDTEFEIVERDAPGLGGLSRRTQARIRFPDHPDGPVIRVLLNVPASAAGPVPTLLYVMFSPNVLMVDDSGIDEGQAWSSALEAPVPDRDATVVGTFDVRHFMRAGYAVATVYYGDIEPDFDHGGRHGVRAMFREASGKDASGTAKIPEDARWGAIGAWAWGLSRVLDYLQTEPAVAGDQVAVAGASRLGKTALWASAQDRRFAMAIPLLSGEGGAALSRRNFGETLADLTHPQRYDYWFAPRYSDYAFAVDELPVDGHLLLALMAPRPVLQIVGRTDTWSDPAGEWQAALAASPVFELYGLEGQSGPFPPTDQLVGTDMGFLAHSGGHQVLPLDYQAMTTFMDRHFRAPAGGRRAVKPRASADGTERPAGSG